MEKVLFLGNCQAQALAAIYHRQVASEFGHRAVFLDSSAPPSDPVRRLIEDADVVIEQVFDFRRPLNLEDFDLRGRIVRFPLVSGAFLWPFTGRPHPYNVRCQVLRDGPYPAEFSDEYLNRAIIAGVPLDAAVQAYLELDIDAVAKLDRRLEFALAQQRQRDSVTGIEVADFIASRFRDEPLFVSPYHPNGGLLRLLAAAILDRIGIDADCIARIKPLLGRSPLEITWLPVHPGVAEHFGLRHIAADQRYRSLDGAFTFAEWAARYMRYQWNQHLAEGVYLAHDHPEDAIEKLQIGLLESPDSARGHCHLAQALGRLERFEHAIAAVQRAIELAPDTTEFIEVLAHLLARSGDLTGAAAAFRQALDRRPGDPSILMALSHTLHALNQSKESIAVAREAVRLVPYEPDWATHVGMLYEQQGELREAELAFRYSREIATVHLARTLVAQGRRDEALAQLHGALALTPGSTRLATLLSSIQADVAQTEPVPDAAKTQPMELDPGHPETPDARGHLLAQRGDMEGAAAAFREALGTNPDDAELLMALSHALYSLARYSESIAAASRALELQPGRADWVLHLGILHERQGELCEAEFAFRNCIELDGSNIDAHLCLAHTLVAQHRREEAQVQLREALLLDPGNLTVATLIATLRFTAEPNLPEKRAEALVLA